VADLERLAALLDMPARLDRIEAQQQKILAAVEALAGGAAVGPVPLASAARVLGRSVATCRRLAVAGRLPGAVRIGRSWYCDLSALRAAGAEDRIAELAAEARAS
jgi:hypothetical protein